ncbi:MAG: hypothetical protein J6Q53_06285 [Oscillospiraceae bacterium]|nr:hypothetical protein [Oscillospiraceae bacterium]
MSRKLIVGVILLLIVTGIVAAVHLSNQEEVAGMVILREDQQIAVSFEDLDKGAFSGELTDGKGDITTHTYTGILLRRLLEEKGIDVTKLSGLTVTSADNYSVEFTAEEILQADRVYVAVTADGEKLPGIDPGTDGLQIIVFGDQNSRRCVRFAQKITIH